MSLNIWFDGKVGRADTLSAPLTTHALHYGSGVFEGIRSYATATGAAVFRLADHLERMRQGAVALGFEMNVAAMAEGTIAVLRANQHRDAYVRPLCWLGAGTLGLDVAPQPQHSMVASMPWTSHLGSAEVRVTVSPFRRNSALAIPPLKLCGAYINSIMAKREAGTRGFEEAMFIDADGQVVECTGENVFMVRGGKVTAVQHVDALAGITRASLIEMTGAESRVVSLDELKDADEIFLTGTSAEVTGVSALDGRDFAPGSITAELRAQYMKVVRGEVPQYAHWLTEV